MTRLGGDVGLILLFLLVACVVRGLAGIVAPVIKVGHPNPITAVVMLAIVIALIIKTFRFSK